MMSAILNGRPLRFEVLGAHDAMLDETGRAPVREILNRYCGGDLPLLLLTDCDLSLPGCRSLFGYADRRRRVAVLSTFRLRGAGDDALRRRIANVAAHELGHLDGRAHCSRPDCVMHPARNPAEVDARSMDLCARCQAGTSRRWRALAALAALLFAVFALDAAIQALHSRPKPFSWRQDGPSAAVLYHREPVLRLAGAERARAAVQALNALFFHLSPPRLEVVHQSGGAAVRAGHALLIELTPADAADGDALRLARDFAERVEPLLQGKGTDTEGCPSCHIHRIREVEEAARLRVKLWR